MPGRAPGPRRLRLTAPEYAALVARLGLAMPPGWQPAPVATAGAEAALVARRVLTTDAGRPGVHPSVAVNLRVLAAPHVMIDTLATVGGRGSRGLHAVSGDLGAALFALPEGAVELSLFASGDLGRELRRAVPPERRRPIRSALGGAAAGPAVPVRGPVRLSVLHELGLAGQWCEADPGALAVALALLDLPECEAALAEQAALRSDGGLVSTVIAGNAGGVAGARVVWLHTDTGWVGLRPDPDASAEDGVLLEPVVPDDLGTWLAPYLAAVLP